MEIKGSIEWFELHRVIELRFSEQRMTPYIEVNGRERQMVPYSDFNKEGFRSFLRRNYG